MPASTLGPAFISVVAVLRQRRTPSFSYNVSSILGASVAPYIAAWLQANYGLAAVGTYLASMAALTLIALLLTHETRHQSL